MPARPGWRGSTARLAVREAVGGGAIALTYDDRSIASYPAPAETDTAGWAATLETIVAAARQASPQLAALPAETVEQAVVDGMTRSLDRFSRYAPPDLARDQRAARNGWGGIGITVDGANDSSASPRSSRRARPTAPASGRRTRSSRSMASRRTAACITRSSTGCAARSARPVSVRIVPAGTAQSRELRLQRASVFEPTVTASRDGDIGVIRVHSFNHRTTTRVAESLAELQGQAGGRLAGIVLDLRSNPGGVLDEAVSLADLFLRQGPIVSVVGRHPASRQYFEASGRSTVPDVPMVVLINGGSASASEIVAAALQDAGRAVVIGSSSYGKGSVQTVLRLPNNGELILTWARLVAPSGYPLHRHGVVPTMCTADLPDDAGLPRDRVARGRRRRRGRAPRWTRTAGRRCGNHARAPGTVRVSTWCWPSIF